MAKSDTESNVEFLDDSTEWDTVSEESGEKLLFKNVGEQFTGTFEGIAHIVPKDQSKEEFDQLLFRDASGKLWSMTGGYKLMEAFSGEEAPAKGALCRIEYVADIDTGQPSPMKDFRVQVARGKQRQEVR